VDFRVLGPVEVWKDGKRQDLGRAEVAKVRCVLAALVRTPGAPVAVDALTSRVWGATQPSAAVRYKYIGWLRAALAPHGVRLVLREEGYLLTVHPEQVDLHRFRRLVRQARAALTDGDLVAVVSALDDGLSLWHGLALAGLTGSWIELFRSQLEWERREARTLRERAVLALGDLAGAQYRLAELESDYPIDEDVIALRMVALYRDGQRRRALRCYELAAERIRNVLRAGPGSALQTLYRRIEDDDTGLLTELLVDVRPAHNGERR
jgi:DNA-binding SARP family transcriptional activator